MRPTRRRGQSLTELLVTIAIIVIVLGMVVTVLAKVYRVLDGWRDPAPPATTTAG